MIDFSLLTNHDFGHLSETSHQTEQQLFFVEFLSDFTDPRNERKKVKKTYFKTLYAIYLLTKHNLKRERSTHYFGTTLISETAFCSRCSVSRFLNSPDISLFCEVTKRYMKTNLYKLHDWVYDFFKLFELSGMMNLYLKKYESWKKTFKLRIRNWLIPLIQKGRQIKAIYEEVMNKLSTKNPLKSYTVNPLKSYSTTSTRFNYTFGVKNIIDIKGRFLPGVEKKEQKEGRKQGLEQERKEHADLGAQLSNAVAFKLSKHVGMSGGDIHQFLFKNSLYTVKKSTEILCSRMKNLAFRPQSGVKALQAIINKLKRA